MTPKQQDQYWRNYARQNAKMERMVKGIMQRTIRDSLLPVISSLEKDGLEQTIAKLEGLYTTDAIQAAYDQIYRVVGVRFKKWTDEYVKEGLTSKKSLQLKEDEEDKLPKKPPILGLTPPKVEPSMEIGFFNPLWLQRLKQISTSLDVAQRVSSVTNTIKDKIRKSLQESQQQFVSIRKIAAKLKEDLGGEFLRRRAETVARTEVTHIANIAAEQSARETGLKLKKIWIHTRDTRTRDAHRNVNKKPIDSVEKFMVGGKRMDKPGDPSGGLANTINCRCTVAYIPDDDSDDFDDWYNL